MEEELKQIKCYCGHTTYCDCGPQEERACTQDVVDSAMKAVSKDVRLPKIVRDGIVKEEPKDVVLGYKTSIVAQMLDRIELKEPKQETLEEYIKEVTKNFGDEMSVKFTSGGIKLGAKWQADRSYSEEDMRKAFEAGELSKEDDINGDGETLFDEWFEQHKKK